MRALALGLALLAVTAGGAVGAEAPQVRLYRPDGSVAVDDQRPITFAVWHGYGHGYFAYRVAFSTVGIWKLELQHATMAVEAPLRVVATQGQVRNRRPGRIVAELVPSEPTANDVIQCRLGTSLVTEDPDYDIVRYRYGWTVDGRTVRTVTSAALSDVLRRGAAAAGSRVECSVTPSDGKLSGPAATAGAALRP